jgi:hypothetical protein
MGIACMRPAAAATPRYKWTNVTNTAAWAPRDGAGALVYDDKMWLLGGWNPNDPTNFPKITNNEVWNSTDGAAWTLVKPNTFQDGVYDPNTDWEGRHTAGYAVHQNKMWIVGGDANQGHYQNDVWNSTDGVTWTNVNVGQSVPWGPRVLHHTVAFDDKLWVIGGQTLPQFAPAAETFYRDVWNSVDGITWQQVQPQEPFWPQRGMIGGAAVFNGRMWILGGGTYDTPQTPQRQYFNDVWSSADGVNWTQHIANAPWAPRQYHDVAVFDGRMWVLEGYDGTANRKDVWHSEDGANWTEVPATPWNPRHAASLYSYNDALWVVAGNNLQRDVWKLTRVTLIPGTNQMTFENPQYSTTFVPAPNPDSLPAGTIHKQQGWDSVYHGVGVARVRGDNNPISGSQSLWISGSGTSGNGTTRSQASDWITDSSGEVITPTGITWLMRRDGISADTMGRGNSEGGLINDASMAAVDFNVLISLSATSASATTGQFQYWDYPNYVNFPGNPTYNLNTVYRVEVTNISDAMGTYDVAIFDHATGTLVTGETGLPLNHPIGTDGVRFIAVQRGRTGNNATFDDIMVLSSLPGDFNGDGVVDAADYVIWRKTTPNDFAKYEQWRMNFGFGSPNQDGAGHGTTTPVPEPGALGLAGLLVLIAPWLQARSRLLRLCGGCRT